MDYTYLTQIMDYSKRTDEFNFQIPDFINQAIWMGFIGSQEYRF